MSNITGGQNLEYAYQLASTLKWRTWPEEKPEDIGTLVLLRGGNFFFVDKLLCIDRVLLDNEYCEYYWESPEGGNTPCNDGDQWMYISDLEIIK